MSGHFVAHARTLIANGYSPLPIKPGAKRPIPKGWNAYRERQMGEEEIASFPNAGIGVTGGFHHLVPIDVDTDEEDIRAAVRAALPNALVAKKGKTGATAFYRASEPIEALKLRKPGAKKPFLEILTTGQSVIPPTIHPDTRKPYRWTTERTLFDKIGRAHV